MWRYLLAVLLLTRPLGAASTEQPASADLTPESPPDSSAVATLVEDETCPDDKVCVSVEDMQKIIQVLKERQCLETTKPMFDLDEVTITVDQKGRVFYTGKGPESPYKLTMAWCHYTVEAQGDVSVLAALKEPPIWGLRFRPKAYLGYQLLTPFFEGNDFTKGIDAGVLVDFLYYRWINLNVAVGFRTFGLGVGVDLTKNFGAYLGYGASWEALFNPLQQPLHNAVLGFDFAF